MDPLIDEAFLRRLAHLRFFSRGRRHGRLAGAHASPRAGMSLEFADYRDYSVGDDFRYIDWNIVGRLDRVLVKTFVREVDLPIVLLLDLSASMRLGTPRKGVYAARLAAALAYLGLREYDRVGLYPFTDRLLPAIPPRQGMSQMAHILRALDHLSPAGRTSFDDILTQYVAQSHESGLVFLLSDFLSEGGYAEGISRLLYRGDEIVAIQIVDPNELRPALSGPSRLVDPETLRHVDLSIGDRARAQYRARLEEYLAGLREFLLDRRIPYLLAPTDLPLEQLIHERLRAQGVLQ
jgi:uncharacterized protein (DUF58 family)